MNRAGCFVCLACMLCQAAGAQTEQKRHAAIAAGKLLEDQERWKDAEQTYVDLLKADPGAASEVADGLQRLRPRLFGRRWAEAFDQDIANTGRVLLVISMVVILTIAVRAVIRGRRSIQFLPFTASTENGAKQIAFWLGRSRAELRSPPEPVMFSPALSISLPFIGMPDLAEQFTEPADLELGGVKLPLKQLIQLVAVPRVRVSGGWTIGAILGDAYAEIEQRRWWALKSHSLVKRTIVSMPGEAQDRDLRLFAYDVLMKASSAFER